MQRDATVKNVDVLHFILTFSIQSDTKLLFTTSSRMSTDPGDPDENHPVGEIPLLTVSTIPQQPLIQHDFVADPSVSNLPTLEEMGSGIETSAIQDFSGNSLQPPHN